MGWTSFYCLASLLSIGVAYGCTCSGTILEDGNTGANWQFWQHSETLTFQGATLASASRNSGDAIGAMSTPTACVRTRRVQAEAVQPSNCTTRMMLAPIRLSHKPPRGVNELFLGSEMSTHYTKHKRHRNWSMNLPWTLLLLISSFQLLSCHPHSMLA